MRPNLQKLGSTKLWVPAPGKPQLQTGARFAVFLKYSELLGCEISAQERYWELLQELPVVNAVGVLAEINGILSLAARDPDAHEALHGRFLDPQVAERVSSFALNGPVFPVVFNRVADLAVMRDPLIYGANRNITTDSMISDAIATSRLDATNIYWRNLKESIERC